MYSHDLELWEAEIERLPSRAFMILFRFFEIKLSTMQVERMLMNSKSPYRFHVSPSR